MRVAVFSSQPYDRTSLRAADGTGAHELVFLDARLGPQTVALADGFDAVCVFVHDIVDRAVLGALAAAGVRCVALRAAGFNNVDLVAAAELGVAVCRVPAYSPYAVAEHAMALILALVRRTHRAYTRVREGNFALDGLLGFDLHGRTLVVVGTGRIGTVFCRIAAGFGMRILAHDPFPNDEVRALGAEYVPLPELLARAGIVALHAPLTAESRHLIDRAALARMRRGVLLVNTSRGALIDTEAVIEALKDGTIGALGLDVYEEEEGLFFHDHSQDVIQDDVFARLLTFPNVLITAHQAFFTEDALRAIAETTIANLDAFARDGRPLHPVTAAG
ncbi:MAG: 2-hydroxyacid dehydrogenase [Chloroflexota bacterium]